MRNHISSRAAFHGSSAESFSELVDLLRDPSQYQAKLEEISKLSADSKAEYERLTKARSLESWESDLNTREAALNAALTAHQNKVLQETKALEEAKIATQVRCQNEVDGATAKAKQMVSEADVKIKVALEAQRAEEERKMHSLTAKYQEATQHANKALDLLQQIEALDLGAVRNVLSNVVAVGTIGVAGASGANG